MRLRAQAGRSMYFSVEVSDEMDTFAGTYVEHDEESGGTAVYSLDGVYRYLLVRRLSEKAKAGRFPDYLHRRKRIGFRMLNPSTASAFKNDPTITRVVNFAIREGAEELWVTNMGALRSTEPAALLTHPDPVGPLNDRFLSYQMKVCTQIVCGWGAHKWAAQQVVKPNKKFYCLGVTKWGAPRHPLYLGNNAELVPWPVKRSRASSLTHVT